MGKEKIETEEREFTKELGLEEETPAEETPKEKSEEEIADERADLDTRAEEVGLEAGASKEDIEAEELSVRAEAVGLNKGATVEEVETVELAERAVAVGLKEDATLEEVEKAEKEKKPEEEVTLEKDLTQEEIDKLPKDAKGLYYEMKKEREKRKTLEGELQFLKLQKKYGPKVEPKKVEAKPEDTPEDVNKILEGLADDDVVPAGVMKRILLSQKKAADNAIEKAKQDKKDSDAKIKQIDDIEDAFKIDHPDYEEMLNVFNRASQAMPGLKYEIIAEINREGGNPAAKVYEIGQNLKGVYGKADTSIPKKETSAAARILKNAKKKKSSASIAGSSISNEALEEMDVEELGKTLNEMSMPQFMKVPRKLREKAVAG